MSDMSMTIESDIETIEQESRLMRARMVRVCRENDVMLDALKACDEAMEYMSEYDIPLCLPEKVKAAIAMVENK